MPAPQANFDLAADDLITAAKSTLQTSGISWDSISKVVYDTVNELMHEASDKLLGKTGAEKKAAVLGYAKLLISWVATKLPLPWWLAWIKLPVVSTLLLSTIEAILNNVVDGLIEGNYAANKEQFSA